MAGFDMPQTGTPPRHNQPSYSTVLEERTVYNPLEFALDASPARNCAPLDLRGVSSLTPPNSSKRTQPSTGKRRREKGGILSGRMGSFLENITNSPKKTPTKSLPFTPSRVKYFFFYIIYAPPHYIVFRYVLHCVSLSVLQHIRNGASESGRSGPDLHACVRPEGPSQHPHPKRFLTQVPERESWVKKMRKNTPILVNRVAKLYGQIY